MVAQVTTYFVIATHEERFWLLSVPELDVVTQARTLDRAEATVRDLIAVWLDVPADSFAVEVEPRLDDEWTKLLRETKDARATADKASARASELLRTSVTTLHDAGLSAREVGSLVGISYQRVQQLLAKGIGQRSQSRDRR
jgi:DNA-directed RNA polymerase specialized sigma24 family protein